MFAALYEIRYKAVKQKSNKITFELVYKLVFELLLYNDEALVNFHLAIMVDHIKTLEPLALYQLINIFTFVILIFR